MCSAIGMHTCNVGSATWLVSLSYDKRDGVEEDLGNAVG
eukprot:COSAG02_NODE_41369_length_395_cov_0.871622_1_plen_38_part_10